MLVHQRAPNEMIWLCFMKYFPPDLSCGATAALVTFKPASVCVVKSMQFTMMQCTAEPQLLQGLSLLLFAGTESIQLFRNSWHGATV